MRLCFFLYFFLRIVPRFAVISVTFSLQTNPRFDADYLYE